MRRFSMSWPKRRGERLGEASPGFSQFAFDIMILRANSPLSIYFTCEFITDTTKELSLCKQNESVLTSQPRILIVMNGGKKWVKVGAYEEEAPGGEGRCFEASHI